MCLDRIDKKLKPCKTGYKVMLHRDSNKSDLYSPIQGNGAPVPIGVWLDEKDARLLPSLGLVWGKKNLVYATGWHVYHTKRAAQGRVAMWGDCIVKVKVDEPITAGWQFGARVTVCKKIKIMEVLA